MTYRDYGLFPILHSKYSLRYRTEQYSMTECANYVKLQFGPVSSVPTLERKKAIEEGQTEGRKGQQNSKREPRAKQRWSQNENQDEAKLTSNEAELKAKIKPIWKQDESQDEANMKAKMKDNIKANMLTKMKPGWKPDDANIKAKMKLSWKPRGKTKLKPLRWSQAENHDDANI